MSGFTGSIEVFFSYCHRDEELREELCKHLSILQRRGIIAGWHDRMIGAGTLLEGEINEHLNSARIILLLVSADFLASDYCYDVEAMRALERHESGEAVVIPIILRAADWTYAPFARLQPLPKDARPITSWPNRDEAFASVARGIHAVADAIRDGRLACAAPRPARPPAAGPVQSPPIAAPPPPAEERESPAVSPRRELAPRETDRLGLDPRAVERAAKDLAEYLGPMAYVLARQSAREARSLRQLYEVLAAEIPTAAERRAFLASRPR